jgi:hypothetical protein
LANTIHRSSPENLIFLGPLGKCSDISAERSAALLRSHRLA